MSESMEDRIHVATPSRRQQARQDGDVVKSHELAAAVQMLGAIAATYYLLGNVSQWIRTWTTETWTSAPENLNLSSQDFTEQIQMTIVGALTHLAPLMGLLVVVGVISHWLQSGPLFLPKRVSLDPTRLASGTWKNIFSISGLFTIITGVPKTILAGIAAGTSIWIQQDGFFQLANYPIDLMASKMLGLVLSVSLHVAITLLFASTFDFLMKFVNHENRLKMTDQQLRDEMRMQNGDPQIHRRRQELSRLR
ncbi:EscU/YscU/HrcU family type III secretion system export apparatus switch protein [Mariniblastus sp.]|nr:EscU/YscU/HrcU family type III secretion system export apparatus switch protein [bacterium]MDA7905873.1 EscU/YscU/HrcU family type III secretion system export apparatus switch protein [Mariniblastus sp.]